MDRLVLKPMVLDHPKTDLNDRHGLGSPWSTSRLAAPQLAAFYRFLVYVPANIYPTVTIVEFPERYISVPKDANVTLDEVKEWVSEESSKRRADAWTLLETQLGPGVKGFNGSFLLGTDQPTLLDVYMTMMAHWTPYPRCVGGNHSRLAFQVYRVD